MDVVRVPGGTHEPDRVAVEEPLEIRVNGEGGGGDGAHTGHDELRADADTPDELRQLRASTRSRSAPVPTSVTGTSSSRSTSST